MDERLKKLIRRRHELIVEGREIERDLREIDRELIERRIEKEFDLLEAIKSGARNKSWQSRLLIPRVLDPARASFSAVGTHFLWKRLFSILGVLLPGRGRHPA
jgi:hypothetical protein